MDAGNKNCDATSGYDGVTCSRLGSVGAFSMKYMAGKVSSVCMSNHIQVTSIFFKEFAVIILEQGKTMFYVLYLDKSQDTGGREHHECGGLTASRKPPAYI
jgi:hypothetical protein